MQFGKPGLFGLSGKDGGAAATGRINAKRTTLVTIEVTGHTQPGQAFGWAVVYGFQGAVKPASKAPGAPKVPEAGR